MIVFGIYKVAVFIWVDSKKWYVVFSFFSLEYSNLIFQVWDKNSAYGDVTVHSAKITDNNPGYYEDWTSPHIVLYIDRTLNSFDFFDNLCIKYLVQIIVKIQEEKYRFNKMYCYEHWIMNTLNNELNNEYTCSNLGQNHLIT